MDIVCQGCGTHIAGVRGEDWLGDESGSHAVCAPCVVKTVKALAGSVQAASYRERLDATRIGFDASGELLQVKDKE